MKRVLFTSILLLLCINIQAQRSEQELKKAIEQRWEETRTRAQRFLTEARISSISSLNLFVSTSGFTRKEREKLDSLDVWIDIGEVYDEEMRKRVVQLLQNEYRQDELDTLLNRHLKSEAFILRRQAFDICRFDTLQVFKDSLAAYHKRIQKEKQERGERANHISQYSTVVMRDILQLDTTTIFIHTFDSLSYQFRIERTNYLQNRWLFPIEAVIEVSGFIGDERFIVPLEQLYKNSAEVRIRNFAEMSLVQMRVEPYFSAFMNRLILPLDAIKSGQVSEFNLNIVDCRWGNCLPGLIFSEIFLELSKYLFSTYCYINMPLGNDTRTKPDRCLFQDTYQVIRYHILNEDLQKIMAEYPELPFNPEKSIEIRQRVFDWMQGNYGNYEIRRIW